MNKTCSKALEVEIPLNRGAEFKNQEKMFTIADIDCSISDLIAKGQPPRVYCNLM